MNKAVFLDRDGVINHDYGYVHTLQDFHLIDGVVEGLKLLKQNGFTLIIVTNQAGVAYGYYTEYDIKILHDHLQTVLGYYGVSIDGIYYCPHHIKAKIPKYRKYCFCRKPNPGMLFKAEKDFDIDLSKSFMVGDRESDIEMALRVGVKPIFVGSKEVKYDVPRFENLYKAVVEYIIPNSRQDENL